MHANSPAIRIEQLGSPAGAGASGAWLTRGPDGTVWLSWMEPVGTEPAVTALRVATFDAAGRRWTTARTVAQGRDWFVNWADFPAVALGENGRAVALWFVNNPAPAALPAAATHDHHGPGYRAFVSHSEDGGRTWADGVPLTKESNSVEFVSLEFLADQRVLAVWLDGRGRPEGKPQMLYSRILGTDAKDMLVDDSVCDCCQTTLTAFPDGTALLAYRGRRDPEVRDIRVARFRGSAWEASRPLNNDDWKIPGCPVNGPQLASDGGRVAAAWFTAAGDDARVLASYSPDAGTRFLRPLRVDHIKPAGRVDTLLLRDGTMLVTWLGADGTFWLRRLNPDFVADEPVALANAAGGRAGGFPRTVLLQDYRGGKTATAQFLAAYARDGADKGVNTLLITVPEGELLEWGRNCDCAPTPEELQGFSMRGTFVAAPTGADVVRVQHHELPGIFAAGIRDFKVSPAIRGLAEPGRQFFGRVEKREGDWWLFNVRFIATPR